MIMPHLMKDFKRISDALYSSNEILSKEQIPENAQRRLQEAEQSLNKAIHHVLSDKRNIAQK
ncbi:Uncharacterised protein [Bacillus freudenreichii]|nr:Uncharacterised protein [Bacillus freudenreichii]